MKSGGLRALGLGGAARPRLAPALARAAVTAGVLAALLWLLPAGELLAAMGRVGAATWLLVWIGFALGHAVAAQKWRLLLRASGVHPGAVETLRAHGAGLFANLCLPSLVGGDVVRAGLVAARRGKLASVAVGSLADRALDTAALIALAGAGGLLAPGAGDLPVARALGLASTVLLGGAATALVFARRLRPRPGRLGSALSKLAGAATALAARPGAAAAAFALSLAIQTGFVLLNVSLARAVGIDLPLAVWLLAWPLAKIVALVPVSLGGIGVREAALAALLAPFGVPAELAVAQSLLWETVLLALGLAAGGLLLLAGRLAPAPASALAEDAG